MAQTTTWSPIVIRRSEVIDYPTLRRLAQLDSRRLPDGMFLVAEIDGELVAAAPIETDEPALGDPFRETADIRRLLELQAASIRAREGVPALTRTAA